MRITHDSFIYAIVREEDVGENYTARQQKEPPSFWPRRLLRGPMPIILEPPFKCNARRHL